MSFTKSIGLMTAAFLLTLSAVTGVYAQQDSDAPGIARVTDGRVRTPGNQSRQVYQTSAFHHHGSVVGGSSGNCPTGNCPVGGGNGAGYCPNGNCPAGGAGYCPHCRGCLHGRFGEHYCKHSPDYGYSPPSKYPLYRRGVEYNSYFPAQWYGAGADYAQVRAPMVYQPTDTTQLGFYYQHVPFWQPQPDRLPARPVPAQWHITPPAMQASRYCYGCWPGYMGSYNGGCPYNTSGYGMSGSYMMDVNQGTQPNNGSVVPPTQSAPAPGDAPQPVTSPEPLPSEGGSYDPGGEPTALPQSTSDGFVPAPSGGTPNAKPLPTSSAASTHIRRIGYSTYR